MGKQKITIFTILTVFLLFLLVVVFSFELAFQEKIYPGIRIAGVLVGGMSKTSAENLLGEKISSWQNKIVLSFEKSEWEVSTRELGVRFEIAESVDKAFSWGRSKNLIQAIKEKILLWHHPPDFDLQIEIDEREYDRMLEDLVLQIEKKYVPYSLSLEEGKIVLVEGNLGREINKKKLKRMVVDRFARLSNQKIVIPVKRIGRIPSSQDLVSLLQRGEKMKGKSLIVSGNEFSLVIGTQQLIQFLKADGGYREDKLRSFVRSLEESVDKDPQDALFTFSNGRVKAFSPAKKGYKLNREETVALLIDELKKIESGKKTGIVVLPVEIVPPKVTTADSNEFGISDLVGKGESYFRHSAPSRIANIKLAAKRLNGLLLRPGEEFSFNKALGEVSQRTGFKQAYVIQNGRTVLGDGGGVCQVSTTLFRAALNAGVPIVERHAHSYRVFYYEQNSPPGLDATVFAPSVDLRFKNDYPCWLLIQSKVDENDQKLEFLLFACPDGRKVKMSKPKVWDVVPPPSDLYIDDPTLPVGKVKQIDFKSWGAKVSFDWQVIKDGKVVYQKSFYSYYRPWRAVFLRGTASF